MSSISPVGFDSKTVEYKLFHKRLRRIRGDAFEFDCVDCGLEAKEWSHIHDTNPREMRNYEPRCVKCHHIYDHCLTEDQRGEKHCRATLTDEMVIEIRRLYNQELWTQQRIADFFGLSSAQRVGKIVRRERWTHV